MNSNIEWIELFMKQLEAKDNLIDMHQKLLSEISNNLNIAIWAKNQWGRFIYVNAICCQQILKCSEEEALNLTDNDFIHDSLAKVCIESDRRVIDQKKSLKFIEHAVYPDRDLWICSLKSPWIHENVIIGTVGIGTNITDQISLEIREKYKTVDLIEIPINENISEIFKYI